MTKAGKAETEAAIAAAQAAFPAWRSKTAKARSEILYRWYQLVTENKSWLAMLMTTEQGKPLSKAEAEVDYAASFLQWFAEQAKRINGEVIPPAKSGACILATREPVGVIAAITPWNFPMAMLTRKLGPALAAGCTAVIKPASSTPFCTFALLVLAQRAGVPDGVINAVAGDTRAISEAIMSSTVVRKITFTGSTNIGKLLMSNAAATMKKVSMELGGNAPFIVFDDADIDAAVKGALANKFRNAGQVCVSANRFYIHEAIYARFVRQLTAAVSALNVGNGMDDGVTMGPLIDKLEEHISDAISKGATVQTGGAAIPGKGYFWQPTVISNATEEMKLAQEETFGPVAACFRFSDEDDVIHRANNTEFGLAAYFYTQNLQRVFRVAAALESGMVGINECAVSTELAPFGGVKESGVGREGSVLGMDDYLEIKALHFGGL
ncbi:MAG: Succinate-semialdehyde dehydrogenase [NADP(+)] GabD [Candidatus Erwinia impunctatus]